MSTSESRHISVMPTEVVSALHAENGGEFLDCTLGGAGHSRAILSANPDNHVWAIDRDARAISRAGQKLVEFVDTSGASRIEFAKASFTELPTVFADRKFDGILADLGLSTDQIFEQRGFSFHDSGGLDMRMDETQTVSALDIVNHTSESELYVALRQGGVGPEARAIAQAIVRGRPIQLTAQLAQIVRQASQGRKSKKEIDPATLVFQAIRMAVNDELDELKALMTEIPRRAKPGARVAIIAFHSIEDQLVTQNMRQWASGPEFSASSPGQGRAGKKLGKLISKQAIFPQPEEIDKNPSARSARLRVFEFA